MTRTRASVSLATVYSSAQCVLSVVGSVGVILLFAGIPQLIYSPVVSVGNLMTFLVGALLITTMVAGNSFLNYKYRSFERQARERRRANERTGSRGVTDPEDKPPSYDAIITSDGLPPDYFTILPEKPPRYEEIANEIFTVSISTPPPLSSSTTTPSPTCSDSLTIISETTFTTTTSPPPGDISSTISTPLSTFSPVEVNDLPKVFQTKDEERGVGGDAANSVISNSEEDKLASNDREMEETLTKTTISNSEEDKLTSEDRGEDGTPTKIETQKSEEEQKEARRVEEDMTNTEVNESDEENKLNGENKDESDRTREVHQDSVDKEKREEDILNIDEIVICQKEEEEEEKKKESTQRILITNTKSKAEEKKLECLQITSLRGASQIPTHLDESET